MPLVPNRHLLTLRTAMIRTPNSIVMAVSVEILRRVLHTARVRMVDGQGDFVAVLPGKEPPGVHIGQPFHVQFYGGSTLQYDGRANIAQEIEGVHK